MKPLKPKKCRVCKFEFIPKSSLQIACNMACAITYAQKKQAKKKDKAIKQQKRDFYANDKAFRAKAAQKAFNAFIRARDKGQPCISCQRHHNGQYHAGHFKTIGANPELRFEELNCHKQCAPCNNHLSGNIANYRPNLIEKIGLEKVEWLEGPHEANRYTAQDYKAIELHYKQKLKELESESTRVA